MLRLLYRTCRDIPDVSIKRMVYTTWVRSRLKHRALSMLRWYGHPILRETFQDSRECRGVPLDLLSAMIIQSMSV